MERYAAEVSSIPQCQINTMMAAALSGAKEYFSQPGTRARYSAWLQNYDNRMRVERVLQYRKEQASSRK